MVDETQAPIDNAQLELSFAPLSSSDHEQAEGSTREFFTLALHPRGNGAYAAALQQPLRHKWELCLRAQQQEKLVFEQRYVMRDLGR